MGRGHPLARLCMSVSMCVWLSMCMAMLLGSAAADNDSGAQLRDAEPGVVVEGWWQSEADGGGGGVGGGRALLQSNDFVRTVRIKTDRNKFTLDNVVWSGQGNEPDNAQFAELKSLTRTAALLGQSSQDSGVSPSIIKVAAAPLSPSSGICRTVAGRHQLDVDIRFQFDSLSGGAARVAMDRMERSVQLAFTCLPEPVSTWVERRAAQVAALPSLQGLTWESNLPGYVLEGTFDYKAIRVYDGDTIYAAITVQRTAYSVQCRLLGIDAPEMPSSHAEAMNTKDAYFARDRLVELLTGITIDYNQTFEDGSGVTMPSLTTTQMQDKIDQENTAVIYQGLTLQGTGKFGRYLARLKTLGGQDAATVLLQENLVQPYSG